MTRILGYAEDSLTLWLLMNRLAWFLAKLQDESRPEECQVIYRPSFGRSGAPSFGEFDAIVLSENCLYLCENKWDGALGRSKDKVELEDRQLIRHEVFAFYVYEWILGGYSNWESFRSDAQPKLKALGIQKPIPQSTRLLAKNLRTILIAIKAHFGELPEMRNVLINFHNDIHSSRLPQKVIDKDKNVVADFEVLNVNYAAVARIGNYITITL